VTWPKRGRPVWRTRRSLIVVAPSATATARSQSTPPLSYPCRNLGLAVAAAGYPWHSQERRRWSVHICPLCGQRFWAVGWQCGFVKPPPNWSSLPDDEKEAAAAAMAESMARQLYPDKFPEDE
jgi:hypothetical protein